MDNFELICKLGSGGFSKVYKVRRKVDNQIYALKKVQILNLSEKQKISSLNEIRVLASIKNKYIINYKEAFLDEKDCSLCLVMEYADGGDLANKIKEYKEKNEYFNEEDIWKIFIQLVKGLKSLHDMGIMHRDIKSSNIFLFSDKTAKLGDLNVCKILSNDILGHTQAGTPAYAAPEVWMERPYGLKSDIWSLGCVLYEMVTLRCPFREDNMVKLYNKVLVGEYKKIPNNFSEELNWIIDQMINSDINKRFSCDEILNCEIVKKYLDKYMNKNIKCYSEKRINGYKINKNINKNNAINKSYSKYNSIKDEKKEDDGKLLKTIFMPDNNLLYLRDQLPKANYNHEIQVNNSCKMYTSNQLNSEITPSFIPNTNNLPSNNKKSDILKIKRNSYQPIYFRQRNLDNNIMILNKKNTKENKGKIKLKHINSALIHSEVNNNNYSSLENNNNGISLRKVPNRKSDANLKNKIKDYLYMYEKEKEKEQHNQSILERNSQEKKFDIKNAIFISSDKLKEILKAKKLKKNHFYNKDFQFKMKLKQNENKHLENNRYNNDETLTEKNKNIISNNINEIKHNILTNNKNVCYNNIANGNNLYESNNNIDNNINNYIYKKSENDFINKKKKKSVDILPKIKLSHV